MDKNAIKKYAVWARNELIKRVSQKAQQFGIYPDKIVDVNSVNGEPLSEKQSEQRKALIEKIRYRGFETVIDEVAFTWFNRFTAIRFMEVNGYLPSHVRVFTDEENRFNPQIIAEAINLEFDILDIDKVYDLKNSNNDEELFQYLLIVQCNDLHKILPRMFEQINDYTELLIPDHLLRDESVINRMITDIPEDNWQDQVQIIGWLYQYYNTEPKDRVFANLKKNIKISKENIPAATQLFTPDWIVRYMVENSLGRLWTEGHEDEELKSEWKYYLDEAEQEEDVQAELSKIREEYRNLNPEDIRCIDPCMGSGHILAYMFDVLMQIYGTCGYNNRDAVESILENNLFGLDIDERAAQLAYFSVMMKARQYDKRFFNRRDENGNSTAPQPHVYAVRDSRGITSALLHDMGISLSNEDCEKALKQTLQLIEEFKNASEFGSLLRVSADYDFDLLRRFAVPKGEESGEITLDIHGEIEVSRRLQEIFNIADILTQKYDVVVTNPPYMGSSGMNGTLSEFVKKYYPNSKSDLFAVFIEHCGTMAKKHGYYAMITQHAWMFLSSFEKLREKLQLKTIVNMAHLGARAFDEIGGEVVQTTAFVNFNSRAINYKGNYARLVDVVGENEKKNAFLSGDNRYTAVQDNFSKIPGSPVAYWVSENGLYNYDNGKCLMEFAKPKAGLATGNNNLFERYWFEVNNCNIGLGYNSIEETKDCKYKWFPCNSGGEFRKWSFNNEIVVNWYNDGYEIRHLINSKGDLAARPQNTQYYFKKGLTWNKLSSSKFAVKYKKEGFIYDDTSRAVFIEREEQLHYLLGMLCSNVAFFYLQALNPTMSFTNGDIERIPFVYSNLYKDTIDELVFLNISLSKSDWDSFETSWDFEYHPLLKYSYNSDYAMIDRNTGNHIQTSLEWSYEMWQEGANTRFKKLKRNEEELNRIFIDIYGLQEELTPDVADKDVTVHYICDTKDDIPETLKDSKYVLTKQDVIKSFISYAVGCMFGRYSLDTPGLAFAGGEWNSDNYKSFIPYKNNIIPICDDEYFSNDITNRFVEFIKTVYGEATLDENLKFIADALGGKGSPKEVINNYFLSGFYADHLKTYQKRPIYWLFDSGKKNGFKCLIYMHRYKKDTIARIRTDYVHEQQSRYRTAIEDLEKRIGNASTSERVKLNKQLKKLKDQSEEIDTFEEKIHHLADQMISIDLDDGVKVNYAKFGDVLAKLK